MTEKTITETQIEDLGAEASNADDLLMLAICHIALTGKPDECLIARLSLGERVKLIRGYANPNTEGEWLRAKACTECARVIKCARIINEAQAPRDED